MSDTVWISTALGHASNLRPLKNSIGESNVHNNIEFANRNLLGDPLTADFFPDKIFGDIGAEPKDYSLPDLFNAAMYWAVSSAAANVLRQFDLGEGALYPVTVTQKDRKTIIGDGWYCINFGNRKNAIIPEESPEMMHDYLRDGIKGWFSPFVTKDGDVAVSGAALTGPDLWIDPQVGRAFFVSDALARALKKAKADKGFFLRKCRVLSV